MEASLDYLIDLPKKTEAEDKLQRYTFSKRIAQTIANRQEEESLVVGIFGAWGEGKTSVLNFIALELEKEQETPILLLRFNPWRYNNEDALLKNFFVAIAKKVGFKVCKKQAW